MTKKEDEHAHVHGHGHEGADPALHEQQHAPEHASEPAPAPAPAAPPVGIAPLLNNLNDPTIKFRSDRASLVRPATQPPTGQSIKLGFSCAVPSGTSFAIGDKIALAKLPKNCRLLDFGIDIPPLDSTGTPLCAFSLGDLISTTRYMPAGGVTPAMNIVLSWFGGARQRGSSTAAGTQNMQAGALPYILTDDDYLLMACTAASGASGLTSNQVVSGYVEYENT